MLFRTHAVAAVAFAVSSFVAGSALAVAPQRTFVASYGLDTNPCSLSAPCRGFQAAINAVAAGGEVVALDSGGYGTMEIHKSVSVIVPTGIHAGLSPSTGIPLPGYPGQFGVVLIDIQDTDIVVLRGLNINHQGTVTGGIQWISTHGGAVHIEDAVVNGFPKEAVYVQAPGGSLFTQDSIYRNNGTGIYAGLASHLFADNVRVENSVEGIRIVSPTVAKFSNCAITLNGTGWNVLGAAGFSVDASLLIDHCSIHSNAVMGNLDGSAGHAYLYFAASTFENNGLHHRSVPGSTTMISLGNNSRSYLPPVDAQMPPI